MSRRTNDQSSQRPLVEGLEHRVLYSISHETTYVKHPGPTDTQVNTATNPSGNQVPGQSSTTEVSNHDAHHH
jgi:hypothetical protein